MRLNYGIDLYRIQITASFNKGLLVIIYIIRISSGRPKMDGENQIK